MKKILENLKNSYEKEPEKTKHYIQLIIIVFSIFFLVITGVSAFLQNEENIFLYFIKNLLNHYCEFIMLLAVIYLIYQLLGFIDTFEDAKNPKIEMKYKTILGMMNALTCFTALSIGTSLLYFWENHSVYTGISLIFQLIEKGCLIAALWYTIRLIKKIKEEKVNKLSDALHELILHSEIIALFGSCIVLFLFRIFALQTIIKLFLHL